jgi:hypothetical protein
MNIGIRSARVFLALTQADRLVASRAKRGAEISGFIRISFSRLIPLRLGMRNSVS